LAGKELATETTDRTDKFFPAMKERKKTSWYEGRYRRAAIVRSNVFLQTFFCVVHVFRG
jgi:hypothetical protein